MMIVKVPGINGLGRTAGVRDAGNKILEGMDVSKYKHEEIHVDNNNLEEQEFLIRRNAVKLFGDEDKVIFLGGDHSISYPLVDSFRKVHGDDVRLIVFDAHADLMPVMKEPTHEEWLRGVIESGLSGNNVMLIGAKKVEKEEREFMDMYGVQRISVEDVRYDSAKTIRKLRGFIDGKKLYVSFDMDVLKSVKATGFPEGEMSEDEAMRLLGVVMGGNVKAMDLVEVHLDKPELEESLRLARGVLGKFLEK